MSLTRIIMMTKADAPAYYELCLLLASRLNLVCESVAEACEEILKPSLDIGWIVSGDTRVGVLGTEHKPEYRHVSTVAIFPEHQRKGFAADALRQVLARWRLVRIGHVDLLVHPENAPAIGLYTKLGFAFSSRHHPCISNYEGSGEPRDWYDWVDRSARGLM